jgi:acyl transferase domain-containing protein/acyl carrier protein
MNGPGCVSSAWRAAVRPCEEKPTMTEVDYDAAIAVIGMAGRFPGADSVEELWDNLLAGRLGLRQLGDDELMAAGVRPAQLADPDYVRTCGSVNGYDMFDASLFGFGRREAEVMDPQHRLFLESCFEALENAGYPAMEMTGKVGIFAGCGYPDYMWNVAFDTMAEAGGALMMAIGNERDSFSSLVSYKLNLRGPSITVQTFCSTALTAVHLAVQALLNFECKAALAGGAFIPLPQGVGYAYEEGGILSPDGKARVFDAGARGSVMGSGVSVVMLKRLSDALADGDHIDAVILGSAANNDGSVCAGYTAPGVDGQAEVIADALRFAGVKPGTIGYVECHGTGTVLGDSIEVAAMARVFPDRPDDPVVLGSLKASIGHLDRAAGTSSLIRAILALQHRILPAMPHFQTPNPTLVTARRKFVVLNEHRPWPAGSGPRRAGVSAFGLGGSNVHVVLEEPPARPEPTGRPGPHLLVISGRDETAVDQATERMLRHLDRHPELIIADVAFTLQQSRSYFPVRRAVVCDDAADARRALGEPRRWLTAETHIRDPLVDLILADPDHVGAQWYAEVEEAARRITGGATADPSPTGAVLAIAATLRKLGVRIGWVSGSGPASAAAARVAAELGLSQDRPGQAQLVITPDSDGSPAAHWLARAVAQLWQAGVKIQWAALHPGRPRRVPLPTYPFQRRRYWVDGAAGLVNAPAAAVEGRVDDVDRWTYLPAWNGLPVPIANQAEQARAVGTWLVLAAEERGEAVAAHLRQAGAEVVVARPGEGFSAADGGNFLVRPGCSEDLERLLGSVGTVPGTVIHAFSLGVGDSRTLGYSTALALTVSYSTIAPDLGLNLAAITEGAVSVAGTAPSHPDQAALAGLLPVLAQENPGWICRHIDIGPTETARAAAASAASIVAEALTAHGGPVALRGTSRWVRSFSHLPLPAADDALAPGSVVLITGGLGHVGLILARHLAITRKCRVLLTSRTPLPPRPEWDEHAKGSTRTAKHVGALLELERLGGEVVAVAADATDVEQMRAVVAIADERFGGVDLVVHAAGISDASGFGPAHMISAAGREQHFDAKLKGFDTLRQVFAGRDVPGITLSSLSAVLGGLSLGPYSAANAALDARVMAARVVDGQRWITVNWDTWGRAAGPDAPPPGEFDMTPAEAVEIFERAVAVVDRIDHLVISTGSLQDRFQQWVIDRGMAGVIIDEQDVERDPRPDVPTPYVQPAEGTESVLAAIWARVLRLDMVGADDDFFGLGGNSVLAIEVVARVRKEMKIPVPTSAVLGYPTVRGLAEQIDALL